MFNIGPSKKGLVAHESRDGGSKGRRILLHLIIVVEDGHVAVVVSPTITPTKRLMGRLPGGGRLIESGGHGTYVKIKSLGRVNM